MSAHHAFHWPDHVIGKRESRRIRDEHNALFNSHAELLAACQNALYLADIYRKQRGDGLMVGAFQDIAMRTRAAISEAEGSK